MKTPEITRYIDRYRYWAKENKFLDRLHAMDESERDRRWGRVIDEMSRAAADPKPSLETQAFLLGYYGEIVIDCAGMSDRDNHRAVMLGAEALGLDYATAKIIFAELERSEPAEVVARYPGFISFPHSEGYIYFAEDRQAGRLKIGFSLNPLHRVDQLSRIVGRPLVLVGLATGPMLAEHYIHCQLKAHRIAGEWFHADRVRASEFMDKAFGEPAFERNEIAVQFAQIEHGGLVS